MDTSPSVCPSLETLAAGLDGGLRPQDREAVEAHALACARCRLLLLEAGISVSEARQLPAVRSRLPGALWRAVAALLLLALSVAWMARGRKGLPGPSGEEGGPAPTGLSSTGLFPGSLGAGGGADAGLMAGMDLLLEPGALASTAGPGRCVRLEAGMLWMEVSDGQPALLQLPAGGAALVTGSVAVEVLRAPAATASASSVWKGFLESAWAGEDAPSVLLWVLEGGVEVLAEGKPLRVAPGSKLAWVRTGAGMGWRRESPAFSETGELQRRRMLAAAALPVRDLLPAGSRLAESRVSGGLDSPVRYRWVTELKARDASGEVGLTLPVEGGWVQWVVGLAGTPPGEREVVEVTWDGRQFRGRVNGRTVLVLGKDRLRDILRPVSAGWGLQVWGGGVTVVRSGLRDRS